MSDDGAKPFEATARRVAKARREGNVARASDFGANAALAGAIGGCTLVAAPIGAAGRTAIVVAAGGGVPWAACATVAALACVPLAVAAAAGTFASIAQGGGLHVTGLSAKFERVNPLEGFRRLFSRETLFEAVRATLAFSVAILVMFPAIRAAASETARAGTVAGVAAAAWNAAQHATLAACATGLLFSFAQYAVARSAWLRKLRMSLDERKREVKEEEGDPLARGRRRALHRSFARGSLARVKDAAFVVANPTHVAVALEYRLPEVPVPRVLVRAAEDAALRVRALAAAHRIPVIENVALARALYAQSQAGATIPVACYVAVAEVVAALQRSGELTP